ncbi:MAG: hypothetical protein WBW16_15525 [Bacteroidota bacterium]
MAQGITNLVHLFIAPSRLFARLKNQPSWVMSFAALAVVGMTLDWFSFEVALQASLSQLPQRATPEMIQDAVTYLEGRRFINVAFSPIKVGIAIAVFSYVLYLVCSVSRPVSLPGRKHFLSVVVWSSWILMIEKAVALVVRSAIGPVNSNIGLAFSQPLGLGIINVSSSDPGLLYALNAVNVFSVWYLFLVSAGISILCGFGRLKSILVVASVWLTGVVVSAGLMRFALEGVH